MAQEQQRFGKYRLLRRIAAGGMGEVHLAKLVGPAGFEKLVVIKRLLEQRRSEAKYLEMFFGEARVAAQLNHSNIVQIYETGEVDDVPYIAMEFVHGKSLRKILDTAKAQGDGHLPAAFAGFIIAQLCRGLSFAHNAHHLSGAVMDLIHRDINPLNVLVSYQGEVKIIDFGIAKSELTLDKTQAGTIKGTVVYMSPEQSLGHKLDRRSDLFSVGICLYEALSGQNPFHKGSLGASLDAIRRAAAPPLVDFDRALQPFAELLARVLTARPEQRFGDCSELADQLEALLASGRIARPMLSLSAYMQKLFAGDIRQEVQNLERTDFANLEDLASGAAPKGRGTALLPPRNPDSLDGERTSGRGPPALQTSSVFTSSSSRTGPGTGEQLAATSERGTPQPSPHMASFESTDPEALREPAAREPEATPAQQPPIISGILEPPEAQAPLPGRPSDIGRQATLWLGRRARALDARAPGLAGFLHWWTLAPGKPGGRFGLPAVLVLCVLSLAGWLAMSFGKRKEVPAPRAAIAAVPDTGTPSFLAGEIDAENSSGAAAAHAGEQAGRPQSAKKPAARTQAQGREAAPKPAASHGVEAGEAAAPERASKQSPEKAAKPAAAQEPEPMAHSLRPSVAPLSLGPELRLRADPPMSLRHNGQLTQNAVRLHPGSGLLECRSGPSNGTFDIRITYQARHGEVDLTIDTEPWADVYGAGGIKLGRTPVALNRLGESTPIVLKNPHVSASQYLTIKLSGLLPLPPDPIE